MRNRSKAFGALLAVVVSIFVSQADAAECNRPAFHTILDVGHTPESPGATSARGMVEYDFNLRLARRIERAMREGGLRKPRSWSRAARHSRHCWSA
jgi:N-acetylmuramoyl-L-alanine amidase